MKRSFTETCQETDGPSEEHEQMFGDWISSKSFGLSLDLRLEELRNTTTQPDCGHLGGLAVGSATPFLTTC